MLTNILNVFFSNIRTVVAAGVANAIKAGVADGVHLATESLSIEYSQPEDIDNYEIETLQISDLTIE